MRVEDTGVISKYKDCVKLRGIWKIVDAYNEE